MNITIREMRDSDWNEVSRIYREGIETGKGTFERDVPDFEKWDKGHLEICRFIAEADGEAAGFAVLQHVSARKVYDGVAEVSIYIDERYRNLGVGTTLLNHLINESEKNGFWTLVSSIFADNKPSRSLHRKCGFREVGYREKLARDFNGVWRDTVLVERRSKTVGN